MFRRILVPLDGSRRAEQALPIAARIARSSSGTIVLYRVVGRPSALALYGITTSDLSSPEAESLRDQAQAYLTAVSHNEALVGITIECAVSEGLVAEEILAAHAKHSSDLVVMCSHGHSEPSRWLLGSVAEKVARLSETPVLVLRERGIPALIQAAETATAQSPLRVLVPLDGSPLAEGAVQPACALALALTHEQHAAIHFLTVIPPGGPDVQSATPDTQRSQRAARAEIEGRIGEYLGRLAAQIGETTAHALEITSSVEFSADAATTILRVAGQQLESDDVVTPIDCNVIALTTHGSGGKRPWSIGTVADRVLYATELPLLVIRP